MANIPMRLWYTKSAPEINDFTPSHRNDDPMDGWEKWSLPIGNGYMGVNVFGRTGTERLQITENSLCNPGEGGGLNNFCELMIGCGHENISNYRRELDLDEGVARVFYDEGGVTYRRDIFASYPDRVLVVRHEASEKGRISFTLRPVIPFLKESEAGYSKRGEVHVEGDTAVMTGEMTYYGIKFEGRFRILHEGGALTETDGGLRLENADSAVIVAAIGTNYRLESRVFTEHDPKKKLAPYPHPHERVCRLLDEACARGYDALLERHKADYRSLMGRVTFEISAAGYELPTDELLARYAAGEKLGYLEMVYFQFGRHLLISSSRPGTLPANLQGVWNCYDQSPWGAGYWHNINVQMNYWPSFPANLAETFTAYADYARAYMDEARSGADFYIRELMPENYTAPGTNGWMIGTAGRPYSINVDLRRDPETGAWGIGHSGPGMGAFTSILFWEYYAFTQDERVLRDVTYPILHDMGLFLEKTLVERDGAYLAKYSASPEQMIEGRYVAGGVYYHTTGCAFDQQLIWENQHDLIRAAALLGESDQVIETAKAQIDHLDPVQVGASGQVKEYREESAYGEIGEWEHRHISHLCGLYPGSVINRSTPEWMQAARTTLNLRGDKSTGWAMAHRLNAWARVMDGNRAHKLYRTLLSKGTFPNLWDAHPPFQIDGNLGGVSGVCEMLLQSQAGFIDVLPALPDEWASGRFEGLVARGNVVIDARWTDGRVEEIALTARHGGLVRLRCDRMDSACAVTIDGQRADARHEDGCLTFDLPKGSRAVVKA